MHPPEIQEEGQLHRLPSRITTQKVKKENAEVRIFQLWFPSGDKTTWRPNFLSRRIWVKFDGKRTTDGRIECNPIGAGPL